MSEANTCCLQLLRLAVMTAAALLHLVGIARTLVYCQPVHFCICIDDLQDASYGLQAGSSQCHWHDCIHTQVSAPA